jgi:hypothetical protein
MKIICDMKSLVDLVLTCIGLGIFVVIVLIMLVASAA